MEQPLIPTNIGGFSFHIDCDFNDKELEEVFRTMRKAIDDLKYCISRLERLGVLKIEKAPSAVSEDAPKE